MAATATATATASSVDTARSSRVARMDSVLSAFNVDEMPHFSRTILTSSPVLLVLHAETGKGGVRAAQPVLTSPVRNSVPLPHVAVGLPTNFSPPSTLVRRGSSSGVSPSGAAEDGTDLSARQLPESLQTLLRLHKRATFNLFHRWERNGLRTVPLNGFADGVREICGVTLTDADLLAVLQCVEPLAGDGVLEDAGWRRRPLDCARLRRRLQSSTARLASDYIRSNSLTGAARPTAGGAAPPRSPPTRLARRSSSWSEEQLGATAATVRAPPVRVE